MKEIETAVEGWKKIEEDTFLGLWQPPGKNDHDETGGKGDEAVQSLPRLADDPLDSGK